MINHSIQSVVKIHEGFVKENIMKQEEFDKYYILKGQIPENFIVSDENKNLNQKICQLKEIPFEELKKGITCLFLSSVFFDDKIEIYVTKTKYKVIKKILNFSFVHSYNFTYKYSRDNQKWELIDNSE